MRRILTACLAAATIISQAPAVWALPSDTLAYAYFPKRGVVADAAGFFRSLALGMPYGTVLTLTGGDKGDPEQRLDIGWGEPVMTLSWTQWANSAPQTTVMITFYKDRVLYATYGYRAARRTMSGATDVGYQTLASKGVAFFQQGAQKPTW